MAYPPPPSAVTLAEAKELIRCLADRESVLLLSPPGVGKSEAVRQAARDAGLELRSLLGTQIAPEDVPHLPDLGFGGLSTFADLHAGTPNLAIVNCGLDIIDWRNGR